MAYFSPSKLHKIQSEFLLVFEKTKLNLSSKQKKIYLKNITICETYNIWIHLKNTKKSKLKPKAN